MDLQRLATIAANTLSSNGVSLYHPGVRPAGLEGSTEGQVCGRVVPLAGGLVCTVRVARRMVGRAPTGGIDGSESQ